MCAIRNSMGHCTWIHELQIRYIVYTIFLYSFERNCHSIHLWRITFLHETQPSPYWNDKKPVKLTKITSIREMHTHQNRYVFFCVCRNAINRIDSHLLILFVCFLQSHKKKMRASSNIHIHTEMEWAIAQNFDERAQEFNAMNREHM